MANERTIQLDQQIGRVRNPERMWFARIVVSAIWTVTLVLWWHSSKGTALIIIGAIVAMFFVNYMAWMNYSKEYFKAEPTWGKKVYRVIKTITVSGFMFMALMVSIPIPQMATDLSTIGLTIGWAGAALLMIMWIHYTMTGAFENVKTAMTPLPAPAELAGQFREEFGRYPTAEEVNMMYTYLQDQQRQATLNAAMVFGAIAFVGYQNLK